MMPTGIWILLMVGGLASGVVFFFRLRFRLRKRPTYRPSRDSWTRGRVALIGFSLSIFAVGTGIGGLMGGLWTPDPVLPLLDGAAPDVAGDAATDSVGPSSRTAGGTPEGPQAVDTTTPPRPDAGVAGVSTEAPSSPEGEGAFAVRVGVFGNPENAEGVVRDLREAGHTPFVARRTGSSDNPLYYVYAGTFPTRDEAEAVAAALRSQGGEAMVVEIPSAPPGG